jgi:hypothetical protein
MSIDKGFDISQVPIGKPPSDEQFKIWSEKSRLRRLDYEFVDLNEHPKFLQAVDIVKENINIERSKNGLSRVEDEWPEIRFVDESDWNDISVSIGQFEEIGGFFERESNVIFLVCDMENFAVDKYENLYNLYGVAHELGHFTIPIDEYSFHLAEGIVDANARACLTDNAIDLIIDPNNRKAMKLRIDEFVNNLSEYRGQPLFANDIVAIKETGEVLGASYISQTRMINSIRDKVGIDEYNRLIKLAFNGNIKGIKKLLSTKLGIAIEKLIDDTKADNDVTEIQELIKSY